MSASPVPLQVDHLKLARENTLLEGFIALDELCRFADLLESREGVLQIGLKFGMVQNKELAESMVVEVKGRLEAQVELECQKCMQNYVFMMNTSFCIKVIEKEEELEESEDIIICPNDHNLAIIDLIEDELILALPMIPKHETCSVAVKGYSNTPLTGTYTSKNKPFINLKQLLNSDKRS